MLGFVKNWPVPGSCSGQAAAAEKRESREAGPYKALSIYTVLHLLLELFDLSFHPVLVV